MPWLVSRKRFPCPCPAAALDCNWIATGRVPLLRLSTLGALLSLSLSFSLFAVMEVMPPKPCAIPVFGGFANEAVHDR
jgi:hypothetical protein